MRVPLRCALAVFLATAIGAVPMVAGAMPRDGSICAVHAPEAARRSGLPVQTILRVMAAESAGNPRAVSSKGAIGCMQIMPRTWRYLSRRYALGPDPFDPQANMIGGAMYLAELAARFGFPDAYSAYNAGPGRYEQYLAGRAALPAETLAYTARIGRTGPPPAIATSAPRWQEASLFLVKSASSGENSAPPETQASDVHIASHGLFPLAGE